MKVLHFYKTYYPDTYGGVEHVIFQLASGGSNLGIEASVLSLTPNKVSRVIQINGHEVVRCHSNLKVASTDFSFSAFYRFYELTKTVDIIHYHFPWPFMDLVHFATNLKKPTVVTYHSDIIKQKNLLKIYAPLMHKFLKSVDVIVATSPNYLVSSDVLQRYYLKTEIIPIGLDKSLYPSVDFVRTRYWQNIVGSKFFLFIGVLRYYKGLFILLEALTLGDFPTVIVGAGPIEHQLKVQAASLGLKNVIFLGSVSEVDKVALINLSYAIVFPSHLRSEAFGISLLEGAMFGKPMISSEIGTGTSFINIDQQTGIVVPPSSAKDLNIAMAYLWNNPEIAMRMGSNALDRYLQLFTADNMCRNYKYLYDRLLNKRAK
jgi:glycosyltransferase involved in cell wall biosynthesis